MIILKGKNFVEEHDEVIVISYKFQSQRMYLEPLLLVGSYFIFFTIASIVARLDVSSKKSKDKQI